ncbi:GGDEF domain-containing protein [Anaerobacillus alkaliphilus]|nr:GGDEF domain-containing protein [Anaerobacillus alkaliphilus]
MKQQNTAEMNYQLWSYKILYFYWLLAIIAILGQLVGLIMALYYYPETVRTFIQEKVLVLIIGHLVILLLCEYLVKVKKVYHSWVLITTGTLLTLIIIIVNPAIPGLQVILLLPMAVALIYLEKSKLLFSFSINLIGLTCVHIFFLPLRMATSEYEYLAYYTSLCAGYIIYLAILQRGNEVLEFLYQSNEKEKELIIKNAVIERLSKTDALTELYNHKTFHEYMDYLVEQSKNYEVPLQLAIIDIDNFKCINDTYGHSAGDVVLKRIAATIRELATENDIVARYGGEEFAILFTEKSLQETEQIIENIRRAISSITHKEIQERVVTISVGLSDYHSQMSKYDFFEQTDELLYEAKRSGKNKVVMKR